MATNKKAATKKKAAKKVTKENNEIGFIRIGLVEIPNGLMTTVEIDGVKRLEALGILTKVINDIVNGAGS